MDTNEIATEILELLIQKVDKQEKGFVNAAIDILTLCTSEIIKAGYCDHHYAEALKKVNDLINSDLETAKDNCHCKE